MRAFSPSILFEWLFRRPTLRLGAPLTFVFIATLWPIAAYASAINVTGGCTLAEAITSANTDAAVGGCTAGNGNDILVLDAITYSLNTVDNTTDNANATPDITTTMTISGVTGSVIERSDGPQMRLFHVADVGNLTIKQVILRNGNSSTLGGALYNAGVLTLIDSQLISNTASAGGGIYNGPGDAVLTNTQVISNSASIGAGIANVAPGTLQLNTSSVVSNVASAYAGGILNLSAQISSTASTILHNQAALYGGGLINIAGSVTLSHSGIISNTADAGGGAINGASPDFLAVIDTALGVTTEPAPSELILFDSQIISNASSGAGGLINFFNSNATFNNSEVSDNRTSGSSAGILNAVTSTVTLNNSVVRGNSAAEIGGGISNKGTATVTVNSSLITGNHALEGAGFDNDGGALYVTDSEISSNKAAGLGGAFINSGNVVITSTRILSNAASITDSVISQFMGSMTIKQSCIVNNTDEAVHYQNGSDVTATGNWWGSADGPSGVAPGLGDSVSSHVNFTPFLTAPILDCPAKESELQFVNRASPRGTLLPGQPLTFTLTITNAGETPARKLYVNDLLPAHFDVSAVITTGPVMSVTASSFVISQLLPSQVATIAFAGSVEAGVQSDTFLTNTATLTSPVIGTLGASASVGVALPLLSWSSPTYNAEETSGAFTATVTLSPPTPYVTVTVEATYTESGEAAFAAAVQALTFPPGSSSRTVVIPFADDEVAAARVIVLGLQNAVNARVGSGGEATIVIEDDERPADVLYLPQVGKAP